MPDLLHLMTAHGIADLGQSSVAALWLPIAAWTAVAAISEIALRLTRTHPTAAVRIRSGLLMALPLALLVPPAFAWLIPDAAYAVAAARPPQLALPEIATIAQPLTGPVAPPAGWIAVGLATLAVGLASAIGLARWAWALIRLRTVRATLGPAPQATQTLLDQTRQSLSLRQPVEAALCNEGTAPFTFGWRRPVVAVPPTLTGEPLRLAIAHELAHVQHRDFLWNAIEQGIAALGIAHPLVRLVAQGAMLGREQAADAAVLAARPSERRVYADLLLSYASLPAPGLTLGATQGSSFLHTRIAAMARTLSPTRLRQLVLAGRFAGLLAVLLLVGGTTALAVPEAATAQNPPEWLEGRVTDATTQLAIPAASLSVEDPPSGAATDLNGDYRFRRPEGAFELRVSAAGYVTMTVQVGADQEQLDVALRPSMDRLITGPPGDLGPAAPDIFEVVETAPRLIGGLEGLQQRVVYPAEAKEQGIEGRVFVTFVVDKEGRVTDPSVRRSPDPLLSAAALEAVQASEFIPGRQRGVAVKVRYSLPVNFVLRGRGARTGANRPRPAPGPDENGIYNVVEQAPRLIGGLEGLQARIEYPELAERAGIEGRVFVTFVVDEQGRVQDATIARTPDPVLGEAALKAVQESEFTPGLQRGQPIKVRYSLPVNFRLPTASGSDNQNRGVNRPAGQPSGTVSHSGVDLTLLENEPLIRRLIESVPTNMTAQRGGTGIAEVSYILQPDGSFTEIQVVTSPRDGELARLTRDIAQRMILAENRRPPTPRPGTFRLDYR